MSQIRCSSCGSEMNSAAQVCSRCGYVLTVTQADMESQPELRQVSAPAGSRTLERNGPAAIASMLVPGLGQFIQGRFAAGFTYFFFGIFVWIVTLLILGWMVNLVSCIDAATYKSKSQSATDHSTEKQNA
jgi:TM2 domain-containing membrane protein YozV